MTFKDRLVNLYHSILFLLDIPVKNEWLVEPKPPGTFPKGQDSTPFFEVWNAPGMEDYDDI